MKPGRPLSVAAVAVVGTLGLQAPAWAASAPALPPLPAAALLKLAHNPAAWRQFRAAHPAPALAAPAVRAPLGAGWLALGRLPGGGVPASNPLLLTDGTVLVHASCSPTWYRLKPDAFGSYQHGTWSGVAAMPAGYSPRFFSSAVLPDGRVIIEGGEYNDSNCDDVETKLGAIYDPVANKWTAVAPPTGWKNIGDASGVVLPNGTFLLSNAVTTQLAAFNPTTRAWTAAGSAGKFDLNNEENWTLLPNGDLLTVDAYVGLEPACGTNSELYEPSLGKWVSAGSTIHRLAGCSGSVPAYEAPTQILRPNGTAVAFGSTESTAAHNSPVYTAIYSTSAQSWTAGPNMPSVGGIHYTMADAPAAVLPDGDVLIAASPGVWQSVKNGYPSPTHFFTFDGSTFTRVGDLANSAALASYEMNFLVLPTGQVLAVETDYSEIALFNQGGSPSAAWAPTITGLSATQLAQGGTYSLTGTQLSGLTFGASYGDDGQASTNYPLVRITNNATGHVFYARTTNFTSVSVAPGTASSTSFTLPKTIETGASALVVVANGIASAAAAVTVVP